MSITVALPNGEMAERLSPPPVAVSFIVWDAEDAPSETPIDLLVLRYMIAPTALGALAGQPVSLVQSQTLGFDGVRENLPAGLTYCNAVDVHEASTAELTLTLVLASLRGLPELAIAQRDGHWAHAQYPGLAGRNVLLIGVGGVGRQIQQRLEPFDVELVRMARTAREDESGVVHGFDALPELLPAADVVILAVPLTDDTRHLVSTGFLEQLKPGSLLVNISRGPVVDTDALADRVARGLVRAAIDVTDPEPLPAGHPLWSLPGVIITPHVGGHTGAMAGRVDRLILEQIRRLQAGERPQNVVLTT